ncbi:MAG: hypothetical protein O3A00_26415 [Planctomycetota bacterium]|nr:hypothetical protein [Planctomycetota bacterium]
MVDCSQPDRDYEARDVQSQRTPSDQAGFLAAMGRVGYHNGGKWQ